MLKNYIKIAWRNLVKGKLYSVINIAGLAVGIACCLFILLYIQKELSYDAFHEKSDRIYRISRGSVTNPSAWITNPAGSALIEMFPEVEDMVQVSVSGSRSETIVEREDMQFYEGGFAHATPSLFDVFDFPVLEGEPSISLQEPYTLFLSESMAGKYFPDENPMGKTLEIDNEQTYTVAGIFKDIPDNSHIRFDFVGSRESQFASGLERDNWARGGAYTYVLLNDQASPEAFSSKLIDFRSKYLTGSSEEGNNYIPESLIATPLTDIHLYTSFSMEMIPQGDIVYVYIFAVIALLILGIACINYMNLATARATRRASEVGVRKANGAQRGQLVKQYLSESFLFVLIALFLSVLLVELFLPSVNNLMQRSMEISWSDPGLIVFLMGLWLLTGLGAGGYPALYLSGFQPVRVLKGIGTVQSKGWVRKTLVTFQLAISIVLIISTIIIHRQMQLVRESQPGFSREQVIMIPTRDEIGDRYSTLRSNLLQHSGIQSVTATSFEPGEPGSIIFFNEAAIEGAESNEEHIIMDGISVGFDFVDTFGLKITRGRSFSEDYETDPDQAVMVNEKAVKEFEWDEPLGKTIKYGEERRVVGVLEDFHYKSLKEEIIPVLITPTRESSRFIAVKLAGGTIPAAVEAIQTTWSEVIPEMPLSYSFLDESFDDLYRTEFRLNTLITIFSILAILIACLGLVGLSAYTAEQRTKEIGIRKVLGASVHQIISLLTKDFLKWIAIGLLIAIPVAQYAMTEWLKTFEYKVKIGVEIYFLAGFIVCILVLTTVSWQSIRAAVANPVDSLRNE